MLPSLPSGDGVRPCLVSPRPGLRAVSAGGVRPRFVSVRFVRLCSVGDRGARRLDRRTRQQCRRHVRGGQERADGSPRAHAQEPSPHSSPDRVGASAGRPSANLRAVLEATSLAFHLPALATAFGVPAYALAIRGRSYAVFAAVVLGIALPGLVISHVRIASLASPEAGSWLNVAFAYGMAATGLHLAHLVRARLRSAPFRLLVSIPGQTFLAAGALAGVWLLALLPVRALLLAFHADAALATLSWLDVVPFAVAGASILTSSRPSLERVRVRLGEDGPAHVRRVPVERYRRREPPPLSARPLRIVQISDPHLGPWQTVAGLRRTVERLLESEPDLVLLTGDFLTMEGMGTPGALADALAPLRGARGRSFAIFGNHDHEAREEVRSALEAVSARLLVDDEARVETEAGRVQIVGADWVRRGRRAHLHALLSRFPRRDGHLRLLLLHDPAGFRHVPPGEVDLTLSGHTHGGQVGLVSLGLDWTVLSRSAWPDHGLFALGRSRLYVHRGTGFYGFPLRIGVPGEASVMELVY
jgi:predicted MPP superfamily phosphohydrolase